MTPARRGFGPPRGGYTLAGREERALGVAALAGRAAQRAGASFQEQLTRGHERYREAGRGVILSLGERTVGRPGAVKRISTGQLDFAGVIDGRAVAFDAKTMTGKARLTLGALAPTEKPTDVRRVARQIATLADFQRCGGIAFFACFDAEARLHATAELGVVFLVSAHALEALLFDAGASVFVRRVARDGSGWIEDTPWPALAPSPLDQVARGRALWDWAAVLPRIP